jgi:HAD superfamily hydrolase (TIGR01509 family)
MTIDAVVLDMDGLMLNTEPVYKTAWQRTAAKLGYDLDDRTYARFVGRPTSECEHDLSQYFGPDFPIGLFGARWPELWRLVVERDGIAHQPGLIEFLDFVEGRGLLTAVATSSDREFTTISLRQAGLTDRFRVVVTVDQIAHGKPEPDIYLEASRRLGVGPSRCVALEDSEAGIVAAKAAGMIPLLIPEHAVSEIAVRAAFRVVRSLQEARSFLEQFLIEPRPAV